MITSPTLARFPSAKRHLDCGSAGSAVIETMLPGSAVELGNKLAGRAIMIASSPAAKSETQALNASSVVVAMSPTWTRP
jgi:hypothetical protein